MVQPSILITDDDRDFRETLAALFQPRGFQTWLAGDGQEAIDILRAHNVHVLVLDNHMPRLTGLETVRRAKEIQRVLPCILLSGQVDDQTRQEAQRADVFSVLTKPVSRNDVTTTVALALQHAYGWSFPLVGLASS